jgi:glyoxylase-like metal-dependent hydrolase (beta-lactamase superfamily II)
MHVDIRYRDNRNANGVLVPGRISQSRVGMEVFVAAIGAARINPPDLAQLLKPDARGAAPTEAGHAASSEAVAPGVYRITGRYEALAVDLGAFAVVVGGGGSEARGQAILAETRRLLPDKPVRYVVATHPHFDHAAALPAFAAEGITIVIDDQSRYFMEQALSSPRTLVGDALARSRRKPKVQGVVDRLVLGDGPRRLELHHLPRYEHSDAMLVAYLPGERLLFTADVDDDAPALKELALDVERHLKVQP